MVRTRIASIHGRFQIFHNDHLAYALAAKERCDFLIVGLTNYDMRFTVVHAADVHRSLRFNNPLSYYERTRLITAVLQEVGVPMGEFGFSPFPIEHPEDLENFIGKEVSCYTTIREEWNREKIDRLKKMGYNVESLIEGPKHVVAADIRSQIAAGSQGWRNLVPGATARFVDENNIATRLRSLKSTSQ